MPMKPFHIMAKPHGPICNLNCTYCYYLEKENLYATSGRDYRMADDVLETYIRQYIQSQPAQHVSFAWQGGEPTLLGIPFFQRVIELQKRYANGKTSPDEQKLYARFMEVYAGYLTYTDYEVGRLINHLKEINQLDNTLIFISIGDNGASKEGTLNGTVDQGLLSKITSEKENIDHNLNEIGEIGTSAATNGNYPLGWAQAANTPFKFWKQDANSEGGTHNPLIVYYPKGIKEKGGIRAQYSHVIDLLPTTLDLVGIKAPEEIRGVKQQPIEGTSLAYSINDAKAPTQHTVQYYYIFGSRSIYDHGWKAELAYPSSFINGNAASKQPFDENAWELYNLNDDYTERIDLAKKYPEKLAELKGEFEAQAKAHNLYPYITWDDVFNGRIHRSKDGKSFIDAVKDITKSSANQ